MTNHVLNPALLLITALAKGRKRRPAERIIAGLDHRAAPVAQ